MFKRKRNNPGIPAHIVSIDGGQMVLKLRNGKVSYKAGQRVTAVTSSEGKASDGKPVTVSDVVAQGLITDISGDCITVRSDRNNPIVSKRAAEKSAKYAWEILVKADQKQPVR